MITLAGSNRKLPINVEKDIFFKLWKDYSYLGNATTLTLKVCVCIRKTWKNLSGLREESIVKNSTSRTALF